MIRSYIRQAWTLIKQNKLYSTIYIIGTGLSVAMIMLVFIVYYIKFAPIYPEQDRNRTLVFKKICLTDAKKNMSSSSISYALGKNVLGNMKNVENIALTKSLSSNDNYVNMLNGKDDISVDVINTDGGFWRVFTFTFISGSPYTDADIQSHRRYAVICKSLAKSIFGSTDVSGREFTLNGDQYKVSGVVKDVSAAMEATYSQVWITPPEDAITNADNDNNHFLGDFECYMTTRTASKKAALKKEIATYFDKVNSSQKEYKINIMGQPDDYWKSTFRYWSNVGPDIKQITSDFLIMMFALLFVPALNLCGLVASRMENRLCEMGIRKAFGAKRKTLLNQVIWENLILTALGAVIGLILSYIIVLITSDWILKVFNEMNFSNGEMDTNITFSMLFNPMIICLAILVCLIINIISAVIPASISLRRNIIYSLNTKR